MFKFASLAGLLGFATAGSLASYNYEDNLVDSDFFDMTVGYKADVVYETTYTGGAASNGDPQETYGVRVYSYGKAWVTFEFFEWYKHTTLVKLNVFDITPYAQQIQWSRPYGNSNSAMSVTMTAYRTVKSGDFNTYFIENMKTCSDSIYDAMRYNRDVDFDNCAYDDDNEATTTDTYLTFDYLKDIFPSSWYGTTTWWTKTF